MNEMIKSLSSGGQSKVEILTGQDVKVPKHWKPYLANSLAERMHQTDIELGMIEYTFPITVRWLKKRIVDAFIADIEGEGLTRVFVSQIDGKHYPDISSPPNSFQPIESPIWQKFQARAPKEYVEIYQNVFNGLTDRYQFGGPLPIEHMIYGKENLWDFEWFPEYAADVNTDDFCELFRSGGGAGLLLDLSVDWSKVPPDDVEAIFFAKDEEGTDNQYFWAIIDQWTALGLAEAEWEG